MPALSNAKAYLIGGGIASLAAAAFMIRDGNVPGQNIIILEALEKLGASLDGSGTPKTGYILRGGRMIERKYSCTFDLFPSVPIPEWHLLGHPADFRLQRDLENIVSVKAIS